MVLVRGGGLSTSPPPARGATSIEASPACKRSAAEFQRSSVPALSLSQLPRRDLAPVVAGRRDEPSPSQQRPVEHSSSFSDSSLEDSSLCSSSNSSASSSPAGEGGTPAARLRAAEEAAKRHGNKVSLKLDLSRVLPAGLPSGPSARQPLFTSRLADPQAAMVTPCTPRGREPVRRQDVAPVPHAAAPAPLTARAGRCATVAPLSARGPAPSTAFPLPTARSVPPPMQAARGGELLGLAQPSAVSSAAPAAASETTTQFAAASKEGGSSSRLTAFSPRDYIVEVFSPKHAHQLSALGVPAPVERPSENSTTGSPRSPALILRPESPLGEEVFGSDSSISASSSEGEIRDRLRLNLQLPIGDLQKMPDTSINDCAAPKANPTLSAAIPTPLRIRFSSGEQQASEGASGSCTMTQPPPTPRR